MRRCGICLALFGALALGAPSGATAGPVILGGDDLTDHGQVNRTTGEPEQGWLYMQRAVTNISPNVTRPNDNTIAALGSSTPVGIRSGDAGLGIAVAANRNGLGINYYDGAAGIDDFFAKLARGQVRPRMIWIAGSEASNDLSSCSGEENTALTRNAPLIDGFVSSGGGLLSHGTCYEWAAALLPGLSTGDVGGSNDLYFTPEGAASLPALTTADINAGPWHNYFRGNLGGLQILVRSNRVKETAPPPTPPRARSAAPGDDAAVIVGGSAVTITPPPPPTCVNPTVVRDRRVSLPGGGSAVLLTRQFSDAATPFRMTVRLRRTRQRVVGIRYTTNGRPLGVNARAGQQISIPASVLRPRRGRNLTVARVTLSNGRTVPIRQFFIIVRCAVPRVACTRLSPTSLRCNSRTPLGVRRVRASATSPAGGRATGAAVVRRGRYTVTLRSRVALPAGRYTYRHVGTTRRRGERMVMIRYVAVA